MNLRDLADYLPVSVLAAGAIVVFVAGVWIVAAVLAGWALLDAVGVRRLRELERHARD